MDKSDISQIIEIALEDRTPFEAISIPENHFSFWFIVCGVAA
jgi:hypothetical protein